MNVVVLLAGVADPKWALDDASLAAHAGLGSAQPAARIASPFDESALEIALQMRDEAPDTHLAVLCPGGAEAEPLLRQAAAHRPSSLLRVEEPAGRMWDIRARARLLKDALARLAVAPVLVLLGREFGDADDGALPACLAEELGWAYVACVREVRATPAGFAPARERGGAEERMTLPGPLVASVTNDRGNRLRHPLLKNVMAARREQMDVLGAMPVDEPHVHARSVVAARAQARAGAGRRLDGPLAAGVAELASLLRAWQRSQ